MIEKKKTDDSAKEVKEKVEGIKVEGKVPETETPENDLEINPEEEASEEGKSTDEEENGSTDPEEQSPDEEEKEEEEEEEKDEFGTGFFYIEDEEFFEKLGEKVTDKQNMDDFSFAEAEMAPNKVRIMQRSEDWKIKTTSKRGDLKGKAGDFLLFDPNGNKLKVSGSKFRKIYNTLFL